MSLDVLDDHEEQTHRSLVILYATETGNAQDVAERLARYCRRFHLTPRVYSVDEYSQVSNMLR